MMRFGKSDDFDLLSPQERVDERLARMRDMANAQLYAAHACLAVAVVVGMFASDPWSRYLVVPAAALVASWAAYCWHRNLMIIQTTKMLNSYARRQMRNP